MREITKETHEKYWNRVKEAGIKEQPDPYICEDGKLPQKKKILCIGCADAKDIAFLVKDNKVTGIDIVTEALETAKKRGIDVQLQDVSRGIKYEDRIFDIIICKDVLEHLVDPAFVGKEIVRTLKDDGYAVICVPNHFSLGQRLRIFSGQGLLWKSLLHDHTMTNNEWDYMHVRFFTYRGCREFLKYCGFTKISFKWDLGPFIISRPELILDRAAQLLKQKKLSAGQNVLARLLIPALRLFNFIFPQRIRGFVAGVRPSLLSNHFYVYCRK